ncbi:MAG: hypothetical protein JAY75_23485 [Candidatus Thiodiazotropha taylori]|nr:hypothetical protein [Candidatus Thiodiazotropha taylori]MCW4311172.1 hypothetical protein [Candidatus Thiodiazotropha endolucinida]
MASKRTSANLIRALYNLSREPNTVKRKLLLNAGLLEMIKWFSLAAKKIIEGKMKLPKQTMKFMEKHKDDLRKLTSPIVNSDVKRNIILKPGGGGFLGGVIIRTLIRWDGNKLLRRFSKKTSTKKTSAKKTSEKKKKTRNITVRTRPTTSWESLGMRSPSAIARSVAQRKSMSPKLARFQPLYAGEPHVFQTARQFGFEAAMREKAMQGKQMYNQPFRINNRGPNLKLTRRKI